MIKIKKLLRLALLFYILLITTITNSRAFACATDCRFVKNTKLIDAILSRISKKELEDLCNYCEVDFNQITIKTENISFTINPKKLEEVEINIPILDKTISKIFAEISVSFKFYKHQINTTKILEFFLSDTNKINYSLGPFNYGVLAFSDPIRYQPFDKLFGLENINVPQKIYYSYNNQDEDTNIGLVQEFGNKEKHFYIVTLNSLKKVY